MNVKELIEILESMPPASTVKVWDAYRDQPTTELVATRERDDCVLISTGTF